MQPFPPDVTPECGALITQMLQRDPRKRVSLKDIAEDAWVVKNAMLHAEKIGRPELCSPAGAPSADGQQDTNGNSLQKVSKKRMEDSQTCKSASARDVSRDASDHEPRWQPGCFGVLDRRSTKSISSRLKKLFSG